MANADTEQKNVTDQVDRAGSAERNPTTQSHVSRSGHLWQVCDKDDNGYMLLMHRDHHQLWLQPDGSGQIVAVKSPANNDAGGRLKVRCWGDMTIKCEQDAHIDVAGSLTAKVDGQMDLHSVGDFNIKSDGNINLDAAKNINLGALQTIGMSSKTAVKTDAPKVEVNTDINKEKVTGPQIDAIEGERTISMTDPRGTFTILSKGHLITTVAGDSQEIIKGRKSLNVAGMIPTPPLPTLAGQTAAYQSLLGASGGTGRIEKIMTGNDVKTVVVGNSITNVTAGNAVMTAAAGSLTLSAGVNATVTATSNVTIAGATVFLN